MPDLTIKDLSQTVYKTAMQSDNAKTKKAYTELLNEVKKNPEVTLESLLTECRDEYFSQAKKTAMTITGDTKPILEAVQNNTKAMDNIKALSKDKDIKPILKAIKKAVHPENNIIIVLKEKSAFILKKLLHK